jgi:hypothetical protein
MNNPRPFPRIRDQRIVDITGDSTHKLLPLTVHVDILIGRRNRGRLPNDFDSGQALFKRKVFRETGDCSRSTAQVSRCEAGISNRSTYHKAFIS